MAEDSSTGPTDPSEPTRPLPGVEHTASLGAFETVGPPLSEQTGSRRRTVLASVVVAVVAVLGGGAYAAYTLLDGGGPQPADVLPASTVAVVSIDLDPSAGQKIAAIKSIRKFPALKRSLGLQADDDLREFAFDKIAEQGDCGALDFEQDVKPWLGKRAAFAAVELGEANPSPVIALQISDRGKARQGFQALVDCTSPEDFGYAVGEDYIVASDSTAHARAVLDKGQQKPLADDAAYRKWTGEAGDAGVLSFYVGPGAAEYAQGLLDDLGTDLLDPGSDVSSGDPFSAARDALDDFKGLGGTVRFSGGGMELSVAGGGVKQLEGLTGVGDEVGDLPADSAIALGFGVSNDFAERLTEGLSDDDRASAEDDTGLDLPDDLQALLGHAVTLSLGGDAPDSSADLDGPDELPAGLVIHGDSDKVKAVIGKIEDHLGRHLSDFPVEVDSSGDKVVLSTGGYGEELLKDGHLGSEDRFRDAVPDADKAAAIGYLDFDSAWRDLLIEAFAGEGSRAAELDDNTRPLRAVGLSSWQDGDVTHALLKVTTN